MLSLASSPSLPHHPTMHWPHRRTATTSSNHFGSQTQLCGLRNYQSPVLRCPPTAIPLAGDLSRTFQLLYGSKCSSSSIICHTQALKQRQDWSHSVLCGRACRRIAVPGQGLVSPASARKSRATQSLHWATLRLRHPDSFTST
jgi:hypothetical protein